MKPVHGLSIFLAATMVAGCENSRSRRVPAGQQHPDVVALFAPRISDASSPILEVNATACIGTDEFFATPHVDQQGGLTVNREAGERQETRSSRFMGVDSGGHSVFLFSEWTGGSGVFSHLLFIDAFRNAKGDLILRNAGGEISVNRTTNVALKNGHVVSTTKDGIVNVLKSP